MIGNIRSYCSRNNKTIRLASRNRHRFNILDYSDDYYFYSKLSRSARNKYYSSLSSRATEPLYESVSNIIHLANNTKYTLHDIAD